MIFFYLQQLYVNDVEEQQLTSVGRDMYQRVVPQLGASTTSGFDSSSIFFTDGWVPVLVYTILVAQSPPFVLGNQVYTSEMSAVFVALIQIKARRPGRNLIMTDSMSSLKALHTRKDAPRTHSFVYEIKEACWWLKNNGYEINASLLVNE
jgi:hypothetical protein